MAIALTILIGPFNFRILKSCCCLKIQKFVVNSKEDIDHKSMPCLHRRLQWFANSVNSRIGRTVLIIGPREKFYLRISPLSQSTFPMQIWKLYEKLLQYVIYLFFFFCRGLRIDSLPSKFSSINYIVSTPQVIVRYVQSDPSTNTKTWHIMLKPFHFG